MSLSEHSAHLFLVVADYLEESLSYIPPEKYKQIVLKIDKNRQKKR